jgi:hypothetical protein
VIDAWKQVSEGAVDTVKGWIGMDEPTPETPTYPTQPEQPYYPDDPIPQVPKGGTKVSTSQDYPGETPPGVTTAPGVTTTKSGAWWKWVLGGAAVVGGGYAIYKMATSKTRRKARRKRHKKTKRLYVRAYT